MRTVVFDLDGTLADTAGDLIASANAALAELGHPPQLVMGADDATAFAGGRAMLRLAASRMGIDDAEGLADAGYQPLLEAYGRDIDLHTTLYDGAVAAVDRLRARGDATGICTNKPEGLAVELIERLGLTERFPALIGADTLETRKPDAAPLVETISRLGGNRGMAVLIGDTITDRKTALAAGIPCILVTFGPTGRAVADLNPEGLLEHYDDLERIIDQVLA
ncbi:HAD hydrolase-like protein [Rhodobacteraceae bacterium N5(2021)]|uniref:phosphoglycolate phosphatase n=1 Tax=Gymnodinialimonas phycosphaerae TaxID=2841589 RepID=A0A975TYL8_9RHOB|nr:HAD hydrolase-like protein [Gymnodinialimonas phycosphaerae]MBY4892977.1 HAD hydrolase-like protein [Gymnodinialimonas phycosphaerae]